MRAVSMLQSGDRESARSQLIRLWNDCSMGRSAVQESIIAHFLADTEHDLGAELQWDLLSLKAATGSAGAEQRHCADAAVRSFLPSIHLNIGDAYRRLGDLPRARQHADAGLTHINALETSDYRHTVIAGLQRLRARTGSTV